jgi:hypothetical protein
VIQPTELQGRDAMGFAVGVFTDAEVKELTVNEKKRLKEHVIHYIRTSAEIRRIISNNPRLLTKNPKIRKVLRKKARKQLMQLKKN